MPNFEMYLEIGSQGHKNKLSSKIKKNKKISTSLPRACPSGSRQRPFAESRLAGPRQKFFAKSPFLCSPQRVFFLKKERLLILTQPPVLPSHRRWTHTRTQNPPPPGHGFSNLVEASHNVTCAPSSTVQVYPKAHNTCN
jgi:hypothetical protein